MTLLWRLALRNLFRNQRRSIATGAAIAAGFLGLSLLGAYIYRIQTGMQANAIYINMQGHLQIHREGSLKGFSISPRKFLIGTELDEQMTKVLARFSDEIEFQGKFLTGAGMVVAGTHSQPFLALGFERESFLKAIYHPFVQAWGKLWLKQGDEKLSEAMLAQPDLISVTRRLSEIIDRPTEPDKLVGDAKSVQLVAWTLHNDLNAVNAELGLQHTTGVAWLEENSLRLPLTLLQELLATDGYQYKALFLKSGASVEGMKRRLTEAFREEKLPLSVYHFKDEGIGEFYTGTMNFLYVISGFFVALICTMVSLSIVNALTLGILERAKEIGTLKALGFSSDQIVALFVREAVWLTVGSIAVGYAVSAQIAALVNMSNMRFTPPGIEGDAPFLLAANPSLYLGFCAMLFVISVGTAYIVSKRKLRASAIELLSEAGV